jgi:hypothetical protein
LGINGIDSFNHLGRLSKSSLNILWKLRSYGACRRIDWTCRLNSTWLRSCQKSCKIAIYWPRVILMNNKLEEVIEEMKAYIEKDVAAGFSDADEISEMGVDMVSDQADPALLRPAAERLTKEAIEQHLKDQETWPAVTDCDHLDAAFDELEQNGIVSRQNFSCCQNCGSYEIGDEMLVAAESGLAVRGYTFYHMQDTESAVEGYGLCFAYGSVDEPEESHIQIGHEIVSVLEKHGLNPSWNGTLQKRIELPMEWKRRRSAS